MELDLSQIELPPVGLWAGKIVEVTDGEVKAKKGNLVKTITLTIELGLKKADGSPFREHKTLKLNTRGLQKVLSLAQTWRGVNKLSSEELAKFDPKTEWEGKDGRFFVDRVSENGKQVAIVGDILPPEKPAAVAA